MNLKEIINLSTHEYIKTMRLSDIQIGTIKTINPISIQLENTKILPAEFFIFGSVTHFLTNTNSADNIGKKVVLIQKTGGQKYFVVDYLAGD